YAAAGDRAAALEQYRDCVRVLDRELGVRPLDETTALYHSVLEGISTAVAPPAAPPPEPEPQRRVAFVGRGHALDALPPADRSVGPAGRPAVLTGEAGIGKTRLARELLAEIAEAGGAVASARCFQEESELAYGVVSGLLRDSLAAAGPPEAAPWWAEEVSR